LQLPPQLILMHPHLYRDPPYAFMAQCCFYYWIDYFSVEL
jgi:hypothetical protein